MQVVITVSGGVAEVEACPPGVTVELRDYDNGKEFPGVGEDGVTDNGDESYTFDGHVYREDEHGWWG